MDILTKLFGSVARVKMMKLFLLNPDQTFDNKDISKRAKITIAVARKELNLLNKIKFVKKRSFFKESEKKIGGKVKVIRKRSDGWVLDENFSFLIPLQNLLIEGGTLKSKEIVSKLKKAGNLKLVIISGVFIQDMNSRADILIVGDNLHNPSLERAIHTLESEVGKELRYVVFETADFKYRLGIYDKLLRDILDYSHKKLVNKLGI